MARIWVVRVGIAALVCFVDAFDAVDGGDFADIDENGFELAAVDDFEAGVDARVQDDPDGLPDCECWSRRR